MKLSSFRVQGWSSLDLLETLVVAGFTPGFFSSLVPKSVVFVNHSHQDRMEIPCF